MKILEELIRINGKKEGNRLLITIHSPYILSALNNYIYASEVQLCCLKIDMLAIYGKNSKTEGE